MSGLNEKSRDPSMEDVLASIRKIIAEELDAAHHAVVEEIGPTDQHLPWAEQPSNGQARKTAPVLPLQPVQSDDQPLLTTGSPEMEAPETQNGHDVIQTVLETVAHDIEAEGTHLQDASLQETVVLVKETVVSDAHRAAVAEFEQVVSSLPVPDLIASTDAGAEISAVDGESASVSETDAALASGVEGGTDWQSAPLPFDVSVFAAAHPAQSGLVAGEAESAAAEVLTQEDSLVDPVPTTTLYTDFLETQKPQLNVKLDLSFLQQKFHEQSPTSSPVEALSQVSPETDQVLPAADFSVFAADHSSVALPPFIPANEPSYAPLVSQRTTEALLSSLRQLTEATRPAPPVEASREPTVSPRLDEFMADVLRPLLSQWLDANLERIVDQAVRDEIAKVTQKLRP